MHLHSASQLQTWQVPYIPWALTCPSFPHYPAKIAATRAHLTDSVTLLAPEGHRKPGKVLPDAAAVSSHPSKKISFLQQTQIKHLTALPRLQGPESPCSFPTSTSPLLVQRTCFVHHCFCSACFPFTVYSPVRGSLSWKLTFDTSPTTPTPNDCTSDNSESPTRWLFQKLMPMAHIQRSLRRAPTSNILRPSIASEPIRASCN